MDNRIINAIRYTLYAIFYPLHATRHTRYANSQKLIALSLFLLCLGVGNSTVVLNSCGDVSWVANETYLVNFSYVNSGTYCFNLPVASTGQFTIKFLKPIKINLVSNSFSFFYKDTSVYSYITMGNFTVINANISVVNNGYVFRFIYINTINSVVLRDVNIINSSLYNIDWLAQTYTSGYDDCASMLNVNISNSFIVMSESSKSLLRSLITVSGNYNYCSVYARNVVFDHCFMDSTSIFTGSQQVSFAGSSVVDSAFTGEIVKSGTPVAPGTFPSQVRDLAGKGYHPDDDHDGFSDINPAANRVWLKLRGFLFYQDTKYGQYGFEDGLKFVQVFNDFGGLSGLDTLSYPSPILNMLIYPKSVLTERVGGIPIMVGGKNATTKYSIILNNNKMDTVRITRRTQILYDYNTNKMNGIVAVTSGSKVYNSIFDEPDRLDTLHLGNANYISNYGENTLYDNIRIENNTFYWRTQFSDRLISLKASNVLIKGNLFNTTDWFTNYDNQYVFDLFNSNSYYEITNNTFEFPDVWTVGYESPIYLFKNAIHVKFYNNYIDNQLIYNISDIPNQPLELNTTVGYYYEPFKTIYYFNIGNYWTANPNCTDLDANGICDAPYYLDNGYVDYKPLSQYPFDYEAHLLTADNTVYVGDAYVTVSNPTNGSTVTPDSTGQIPLRFIGYNLPSNNYCSLYIDGEVIATLSNVPSGVEQEVTAVGWSGSWYNFTVKCGVLGADWSISNTTIFYVNTTTTGGTVSSSGTVGTTTTTGLGVVDYGEGLGALSDFVGTTSDSLINTESVIDTTDNIVGVTGSIISKIFTVGILSSALIIVVLLALGVIRVIA